MSLISDEDLMTDAELSQAALEVYSQRLIDTGHEELLDETFDPLHVDADAFSLANHMGLVIKDFGWIVDAKGKMIHSESLLVHNWNKERATRYAICKAAVRIA